MDWSRLVLKILSTGIVFIVLSVICIFLIVRIQKALSVDNKREHKIKLRNEANFASIFYLSADSVEKIFSFKFLLNGIPLIAVPQTGIVQPLSVDPTATAAGQSSQNKANTPDKQGGANLKDGAVKSGKAVAAKVGLLASLVGTVASLLPGSLGSNLRAQSEVLREAQTNTQAAALAPEETQRKVDTLQQQSGKLAGTKPTAATNGLPNTDPHAVRSGSGPSTPQAESSYPTATKKVMPDVHMVQTQPVDSGDELSLVLRIEAPKRRRLEGAYSYTLSSQQFPVEALDGEQPPLTKQGVLHFPHVDLWRYWLAPVGNFLVIAIFLFTVIFVFRFIWNT